MIVDTHVHLYHKRFDSDREAVIERAQAAGVGAMVLPAIDVKSIAQSLALCERYDFVYAMSAIHPSDTKTASDADFERVVEYCDHPRVVAVGESGLDYYWDRTFDGIQHDFLRRHIRLAIDRDLPLILHNRDASDDLVRILREERSASENPDRLRGIFHCYGGPSEVGVAAIEMGFLVGVGGTVTFKNSGVADALEGIPLDRIVVETDAPFLAPEPYRGKRNEPSYLRQVVDKIAEITGVPAEQVESITTENAFRLYGLGT